MGRCKGATQHHLRTECGVGGCKVPKATDSRSTSPEEPLPALFDAARIAFVILSTAPHSPYLCYIDILIVASASLPC